MKATRPSLHRAGIHEGGRRQYLRAATDPRPRITQQKRLLAARIRKFCHPKSLAGEFALIARHWRLKRRLESSGHKLDSLF
jgi:hypothetical protein